MSFRERMAVKIQRFWRSYCTRKIIGEYLRVMSGSKGRDSRGESLLTGELGGNGEQLEGEMPRGLERGRRDSQEEGEEEEEEEEEEE